MWGLQKGPGPRGQYSGKIHFVEKRGVQEEGVAMLLNVVPTPGKTSPNSNFRVLLVLLPPLPHWGTVPGKIRFTEPQGGFGPRRRGGPSNRTPRESEANFKIGTVWGL